MRRLLVGAAAMLCSVCCAQAQEDGNWLYERCSAPRASENQARGVEIHPLKRIREWPVRGIHSRRV